MAEPKGLEAPRRRAKGTPERALITFRVHPGAARARLGSHQAAPGQEPTLAVWVTQRAVDGKATEAALSAVAKALGVRRAAVRLVTGARSRVKVIEVTQAPADLADRLARWSTGSD